MTRLRRLVLLVVAAVALSGVGGFAAGPAEARGPGGSCRIVGPSIDENGIDARIIECYY